MHLSNLLIPWGGAPGSRNHQGIQSQSVKWGVCLFNHRLAPTPGIVFPFLLFTLYPVPLELDCDLGALIGKEFVFSCLPLKIAAGDGSPVRAVAIIEA